MRVTGAYLFGLAVVALGLCPPATPARQPDNKAVDPFQGTWQIVKMQLAGEDLTPFLKDADPTMTFKNDTYAFKAGPEGEKETCSACHHDHNGRDFEKQKDQAR